MLGEVEALKVLCVILRGLLFKMSYQRNRSAPSIIEKSDNLPIYCDNLLYLAYTETAVTSPVTRVTQAPAHVETLFGLIVFTELKRSTRNVTLAWSLGEDAPFAEGKGEVSVAGRAFSRNK